MDTVKGKNGTNECILVLTERVTRMERIMPMRTASVLEVKKALDLIEKTTPGFGICLKTITCDNGSEFNPDYIEGSCIDGRPRTKVYFCHPYSSFERGSNENHNRLIRRFIPKGERMKDHFDRLHIVENYMNDLPRRVLAGYSPRQMYDAYRSAVS
jgi:IS30 family transposase